MNLRQLKKMISEEYKYWLAEQPIDEPGAPGMPGAPGIPGAPGVEVGPNDIDVMDSGEDSEATLRQIYDMLKNYFEGGAAEAPAGAPAGAPTGDEDMDADADADAEEDDEEDDEEGVEEGDEEGDDKDKEALQERFKKLANIIKG